MMREKKPVVNRIRQVLRVFGSEEIDMAEHAVYLIPTSSSIINPHAVVIPVRFPR